MALVGEVKAIDSGWRRSVTVSNGPRATTVRDTPDAATVARTPRPARKNASLTDSGNPGFDHLAPRLRRGRASVAPDRPVVEIAGTGEAHRDLGLPVPSSL